MYSYRIVVGLILSIIAAVQNPLFSNLAPETATTQDVLTPKVSEFIEGILANWNSPGGVGIAVVQKNEDGSWNVETKGYGIAKADGSKVDEDTLFAIGSNSKLFNVIATGLVISNESLSPRITWDTTISSIVPEWELADPVASSQSTIADLMSHRTGLPRHDTAYYETQSITSLISRIRYLKPSSEFRETWQYNNIMYMTLSYIPEVLFKTPFTRYVKDHIFLPLNLSSTTYSVELAEKSGKLANGFGRDAVNMTDDIFGKGTPRAIPYWNSYGGEDGNSMKSVMKSDTDVTLFSAVIAGAGGVISSAKDMATWLQTLLLEGKNPANSSEQVIPSAVIQKVATGTTVMTGVGAYPELAPIVYGGAQMASAYRGHNFIEHGGNTPGFHTQITRFPFDNVGVAVLSNDNSYGPLLMEVIKWYIVDKAFGLNPVDWNSRYKAKAIEAYEQRARLHAGLRPADPTPPTISFSSLEGSYHNPAHGTLHLCSVSASTLDSVPSSSCQDLIGEVPIRLPGQINASIPTLLARMSKVRLTHIRLQHFDGNLFNASGLSSLPIIDSEPNRLQEQQFWVQDASAHLNILIEFATNLDHDAGHGVVGFGITGGFWGAGQGVDGPVGKTIQERAEVWYDRI